MSKTVSQIKKEMTDVFIQNESVIAAYGLQPEKTFEDEFSTASIESIVFYCLAYGLFILYAVFDLFRSEIDEQIRSYTHPTLKFYADKIKTFQYGDDVIAGTSNYDNIGLTDEQINNKKVVKYAAAIEQVFTNGRFGIRLKVAGEDGNGSRIELPADQFNAAKSFLPIFKSAGVYAELSTGPADYLKLQLRVYYNPLVLNGTGQRLDGSDNEPLQKAIEAFTKDLPFNGRFNMTALIDAMQTVDGILDPRIISAQTKYGSLPYSDVVDEVIPDAGYLKIYAPGDLTIEWVAKNV